MCWNVTVHLNFMGCVYRSMKIQSFQRTRVQSPRCQCNLWLHLVLWAAYMPQKASWPICLQKSNLEEWDGTDGVGGGDVNTLDRRALCKPCVLLPSYLVLVQYSYLLTYHLQLTENVVHIQRCVIHTWMSIHSQRWHLIHVTHTRTRLHDHARCFMPHRPHACT